MKEHSESIGKSMEQFASLMKNMVNPLKNKLPENERKLFTNFWNDSMKNEKVIDILKTNENFLESIENIEK